MDIKPLISVGARSASISGGYQRLYEILKRGKSEGINYVLITDQTSYANYTKMFRDFPDIRKQYRAYFVDPQKIPLITGTRRFSPVKFIKDCFILSLAIAKIAKKEDVDLIIYPGEGTKGVMTSYLASLFCSKPWTAIFQPGAGFNQPNLFQPSDSLGPLTPLNILSHINRKSKATKLSIINKLGLGINFLSLLKLAEKTIILTVSTSVVEDFGYLNPRIKLLPIVPGNGVDSSRFSANPSKHSQYQGVYFGRMIPEKGFFDLIGIWKHVIRTIPDAKLAVCGVSEEPKLINEFLKRAREQNVDNNIEFLGQQDSHHLFNIVASSYLTINPSYVEAFSLTTLESLACGTPVIAYDLAAIKHNFGKYKSVFRCPIGNKEKMAETISNVLKMKNREILADEAKKIAALYDWSSVVKAEKDTYETILKLKS